MLQAKRSGLVFPVKAGKMEEGVGAEAKAERRLHRNKKFAV